MPPTVKSETPKELVQLVDAALQSRWFWVALCTHALLTHRSFPSDKNVAKGLVREARDYAETVLADLRESS